MPDYRLLADPALLEVDLAADDTVGVDTEFMREKTLFAELCLVQIATRGEIVLVDPLGRQDLDAFWSRICTPTWVVHSARQDIEVIWQTAGRMPAALFDTQIAAGLAGFAPQLGYAGLIAELFGVQIAKSETRGDWTRRPLPPAMLDYAAEDVAWLLPAFERLSGMLRDKGRLRWAEEDSAVLLDRRLYDIDPSQAIQRIKAARHLSGRRRSIAGRLAAWRETEAVKSNRPRQWILRDAVLLQLATAEPRSLSALRRIEALPPRLVDRAGESLLAAIRESGEDADHRPPRPLSEAQKASLKRLQDEMTAVASQLGVAPEVIAARRELTAALTEGPAELRIFKGWRREVIGDRLLGMLPAGTP